MNTSLIGSEGGRVETFAPRPGTLVLPSADPGVEQGGFPGPSVDAKLLIEAIMAAQLVDWRRIEAARQEASQGGGLVLQELPDAETVLVILRANILNLRQDMKLPQSML
jgi:hypothetical protein